MFPIQRRSGNAIIAVVDIIIELLAVIAGLAGLWFGTRLTIRGAVSFADRFGMSDFVIGVAILSVGSDLPELAIAIDAAIRNLQSGDASGVIVGTAVGSALGQIGFVLGLVGLFGYLTLPKRVIYRHGSVLLGSIALLALAGMDGLITRTEGASLVAVYLIYFASLLVDRKGTAAPHREGTGDSGLRAGFYLLIGLAVVTLSSEITVDAAVSMGEALGVNQTLISILLIGLGSSLPELSISLAAVLKKRTQLSVGNLIGSNIFDTLVPIGVGAAIASLDFDRRLLLFDLPVLLLLSVVVLFFFIRVRGLQKNEATAVLAMYLAYAFFRVSSEF